MPRHSDILIDQDGLPLAGATVLVLNRTGGVAQLLQPSGNPMVNPVVAGADGNFAFSVGQPGRYQLLVHYAGRVVRTLSVTLGTLVAAVEPDPANAGAYIGLDNEGNPAYLQAPASVTNLFGANQLAAWVIPVDGTRDNTAALQAVVTAGDVTLPRRAQPYVLTDSISVPAGRTVQVEPGTVFLWRGAKPVAAGPWRAAFVMASNTQLLCAGSPGARFTVQCEEENPFLSVALGNAVQNVRVTGAFGLNCTQAYFDATFGYAGYDAVVTTSMAAAGDARPVNTSRNLQIVGGGCAFPTHTPSGALAQPERAGAYMSFCEDWEVRDANYSGCYCGVQYWGGDSGFLPFQDMGRLGPAMERKNARARIINCVSRRTGCGFWGSCGADIEVVNCASYDCGDVGHDHEGSVRVNVRGCHGENCTNGAYATFSYCKQVRFIGCTGRSAKKEQVLFRVYNSSQTQDNEDISFQGGSFQCTDPTGPARFDSSFGPARQLSVDGVEFDNVLVDFSVLNNCRIAVTNCRLVFPRAAAAPFNMLSTGGVGNTGFGSAEVLVQGNYVYSAVAQPAGTLAIYTSSADFNSQPHTVVAGNSVWVPLQGGGFAPLRSLHAGANGGLVGYFVYSANRTDGPIQSSSAGAASPGVFAARGNYNSSGADVPLTPA